jgi:probable HAF family extracellular repeat protein
MFAPSHDCARRCVCASLVALAALACNDRHDRLSPLGPSTQVETPPAATCPSLEFTPVNLGVLPGATGFAADGGATAINDKGEVVGAAGAADGHQHAFLWTQAAGMEDLGLLPGGLVSEAADINDAGEVVGTAEAGSSFAHAFLWSRSTGMRDLGTLPGGGASQAFGINEAHQVTGYSLNASGGQRPVVWSAAGAIQDLGTFPGSFGTFGQDINESGEVAGFSDEPVTGGLLRGFVWTEAGGFESVGTLPGGSGSGANALNDLTQVVGLADAADGENHAFLWSVSDGIRDLGVLPGAQSSSAQGINNAGQVVGSANRSAFIWTEAAGLQPLPPLSGGTLASASDINDLEQIVGTGETVINSVHATRPVLWHPGAGTPVSQVEDLIAQVTGLVDSGELEERDASPLLTKLQRALQILLDGKAAAAVQGPLGAFIHQVNALVRSGRLSDSLSEELLAAARCVAGE